MTKELEIEFKNMLTHDEYHSLCLSLSLNQDEVFSQTNRYLDTPSFDLKSLKMGLRVRYLPEKIECTLKVPTDDPNALLEITDNLTLEEASNLLAYQMFPENSDVFSYLKTIGIDYKKLQEIGHLTTNRRQKKLTPDILLVLDESLYYGDKDYELEMEVNNSINGELFFNQFLKEHRLPRRKADKKIARMLAFKTREKA